MLKTLMAAATAFTLMSGAGFAQSSYSSSTTQTIAPVPPSHHVDETTTVKRTSDRNGVMIEKDTEGTEITQPGAPGMSRTTTETTTTH